MRKWHYRYHGLSVASEVRLPEWSLFEVPGGPIAEPERSVDIFLREPRTEIAAVESEFRFVAKQAGGFIVRGGREITIVPDGDAHGNRVRAFLLGSAWGALMYQRGALLIHASAVKTGSGAMAFCARRGAGKSTLAAILSTHGFPLISDDLCCVGDVSGPLPCVYPSVPRFKLCEDAIVRLGWRTPDPQSQRAGKFHYFQTSTAGGGELPLRRIYLLSWGEPEILRLRGFNALTRLTSAGTWRGDLLIAAGNPATHFSQYADLLRYVECWEFRRPRNPERLDESVRQLILHTSETE